MKSFAASLVLAVHCARGLSPATQIATRRAVFSSINDRPPSSLLVSSPREVATRVKRSFSAATLSADDGYNRKVGRTDIPDVTDVKYGPEITIGKLKINLFGAAFGLWEIFWGVFYWYPAMTLYGFSRTVSAKLPGDILQKIDPLRRVPICMGYVWGLLSMTLFGMWPVVEGRENLEVLREVNGKLKPAMYVANHCSWMDIPFVGRVFGFLNHKIISKAELNGVPILSRAISVGGHVTLDRSNRRSQLAAYKAGVQWLRDGVNLVTFPEGTRSRDGRLGSFKKGAFKMAQAVGAPVVPLSIHHAERVQPLDYAFPARAARARPRALIRIGRPIPTDRKSDDKLLEVVWRAIADELPESQKPAKDTPVEVK